MRSLMSLVAVSLVACSSANPSNSADAGSSDQPDGGAPPCAQIGGIYSFSGSTCSGGLNVPAFTCVVQNGCALTMVTDANVLTGTINGNDFTVTDPSLGETCTGTVMNGNSTIHCTAQEGALTCNLNARPTTPPAGFQNVCCMPGGSDCGSGSQCRPTTAEVDGVAVAPNLCHEPAGNKAKGETCTRENQSGISQDDCGAGLVCTAFNAPSGQRLCANVCNGPCGAGKTCQSLNGAVPVGVCVDSCDIFGGAEACGTGRHCSTLNAVIAPATWQTGEGCIQTNTDGHDGDSCTINQDCGAGLVCVYGANGGQTCHQYCDPAHACPNGQTCNTSSLATGNNSFLGFCDTL